MKPKKRKNLRATTQSEPIGGPRVFQGAYSVPIATWRSSIAPQCRVNGKHGGNLDDSLDEMEDLLQTYTISDGPIEVCNHGGWLESASTSAWGEGLKVADREWIGLLNPWIDKVSR